MNGQALWLKIERWIAQHKPQLQEALRPGTKPETIYEMEETLGFGLPQWLRDFFATHDGMAKSRFLGDWRMLPLEKISRYRGALRGREVSDDAGSKVAWREEWFPLAEDPTGNLLCANLAQDDENDEEFLLGSGEVFTFTHEENRIEPLAMEFDEWVSELLNEEAELLG